MKRRSEAVVPIFVQLGLEGSLRKALSLCLCDRRSQCRFYAVLLPNGA